MLQDPKIVNYLALAVSDLIDMAKADPKRYASVVKDLDMLRTVEETLQSVSLGEAVT